MRSWIWGGGLTAVTAVGVSLSFVPGEPPRPTTRTETPVPEAAPAETSCGAPAVTEMFDLTQALQRPAAPARPPVTFDEPPIAARPDRPVGEVIPAAFFVPADDEAAPPPRVVGVVGDAERDELAPAPRVSARF